MQRMCLRVLDLLDMTKIDSFKEGMIQCGVYWASHFKRKGFEIGQNCFNQRHTFQMNKTSIPPPSRLPKRMLNCNLIFSVSLKPVLPRTWWVDQCHSHHVLCGFSKLPGKGSNLKVTVLCVMHCSLRKECSHNITVPLLPGL